MRTDGGGEVVHEVVGDEGDEEAALADAGVADQEYLEGVTVVNAKPRGGTRHRPKSKQHKTMIKHQNHNAHSDESQSLRRPGGRGGAEIRDSD